MERFVASIMRMWTTAKRHVSAQNTFLRNGQVRPERHMLACAPGCAAWQPSMPCMRRGRNGGLAGRHPPPRPPTRPSAAAALLCGQGHCKGLAAAMPCGQGAMQRLSSCSAWGIAGRQPLDSAHPSAATAQPCRRTVSMMSTSIALKVDSTGWPV